MGTLASMLVTKCPNKADGSCGFDNCIGGTGVDCEGVSSDIDFGALGTLSVDVVKPIDRPGGKVELKTSVGSILHDLCCMERPWGAFCHSSNYPIDATINLLGNAAILAIACWSGGKLHGIFSVGGIGAMSL